MIRVALLIAACWLGTAYADVPGNHYDGHGVYRGRTIQTGERLVDYDEHGVIMGWSVRIGNHVYYYDAHGVKIGDTEVR